MNIELQKNERIKELKELLKTNHQIINKCDFFSLFQDEVEEAHRKSGVNPNTEKGKESFIKESEKTALFWKLLHNLIKAKWQIGFVKIYGSDYEILLSEENSKTKEKRAKVWNKWFFEFRDKRKMVLDKN